MSGGKRGDESPTLAQVAQRGGDGVTEAAATRPKPGSGRSGVAVPSPSGASPEEGPAPPQSPPYYGHSLLRNNFRSHYQATGPNTERPQAGETAEGKKKGEELGKNSRAPKDLSPKGPVVQRLSQSYLFICI